MYRQPDRRGVQARPARAPEAASLVLILMVLLIVPMLYYLRSTRRTAEAA